jgi:molybdopterin/thiamine biosynthesis adenylyltransferase/rhodanese-related sulfurtransferase
MTDRYIRQMTMAEIGADGQAKLAAASVLVVGAGGLGSTVLQILAGAGIGEIVILDHDRVDVTNLHRQPLYGMDDIGAPKADAARKALLRANPAITVKARPERLTPHNAAALVDRATIVIDAADNFAVTYILSDRCRAAGKPLVSASVLGFSGYVGAFCGGTPSYRAVFPDAPAVAGSCASVGVLGSAVSILGSLQAHMALQLLLDVQPSILGRVVSFDGQRMRFGGFGFADCPEPEHVAPFIGLADLRPDDIVIDLRGVAEVPRLPHADALRLAPADVDQLASAQSGARIVLCCRSGQRALRAAERLQVLGRHNLALLAVEGDPS